jgi:hypothetical protein
MMLCCPSIRCDPAAVQRQNSDQEPSQKLMSIGAIKQTQSGIRNYEVF